MPKFLQSYCCPNCYSGKLAECSGLLRCQNCTANFPLVGQRPVLLRHDNALFAIDDYLANDMARQALYRCKTYCPRIGVEKRKSIMEQISVLILSRHNEKAASSRLRTIQYIPHLEAAGARVSVAPFFDQTYLETFYKSNKRHWHDVAMAYPRRLRALLTARHYSVIWAEKEIFPFLPGWAEGILGWLGVPYVVDYDDATFHTYDQHPSPTVRTILGKKLDLLLRSASAVTVGSSYLEEYVRRHGAHHIVRVPTVVDISRYSVVPEPPDDELRIGWIGTPATTKYLDMLWEPLSHFARKRNVRLVTIGASPLTRADIPIEQHPWTADTEAALLGSLHVGVMPLPDAPWERGKCGYKLIQYMATGRPVVASPVGINTDIVSSQVGFLASDSATWCMAFQRLANDRELRVRMGRFGRAQVERYYSVQAVAPRICTLLVQCARGRRQ